MRGKVVKESLFEEGIIYISEFSYVIDFFEIHYPEVLSKIKHIPVKIIRYNDWPDGKTLATQSDRKGGIEMYEDLDNEEDIGWLIHEVGHVLDLFHDMRFSYLIPKLDFPDYPNAEDEQTPMFMHFTFLLEQGYTENRVLKLLEESYSNVKGGGSLWTSYKESFFRLYYNAIKLKYKNYVRS